MLKKLLLLALLIMVLTVVCLKAQNQPVTATLRISGSMFLEKTLQGNVMVTNFEKAPNNIMSIRNYGASRPKWSTLPSYYYAELPAGLDKSLYACWDVIRLTNENNVYTTDLAAISNALLTNQGKFMGSDGVSATFSFAGITPGWYYVEFIHRNSLTLFTAQKYYFSQGFTEITIGRPEDYYGGAAAVVDMGDERWGMVGGDCYPDNYVDYTDYISLYNDIFVFKASGYLFTDLDMSDSCTMADMELFENNIWRGAYSPYPPKKLINREPSDNPQTPGEYRLTAKNIITTASITEFDIFLEGDFSFNAEQFVLECETVPTTIELTETIVDITKFKDTIINNKVVIGFFQTAPSVPLTGEMKICHVKLFTSGAVGNMKWVNHSNPRTKIWKTDLAIIEITDSLNHYVQNPILNIVGNTEPVSYGLDQNYPNPFNPITVINYRTITAGDVGVYVYDITGQLIKILVKGFLPSGSYSYTLNASDLPSGVYYYKLIAGEFVETKKMLLIK